jgi:F-type H+-transporting ATPase subunit delta
MGTGMGHINQIAAPYARAAFDFALANKALDVWLKALSRLAQLASDQHFQRLLNNPLVSQADLSALCLKAVKAKSDDPLGRFIAVIATYKRFDCLVVLHRLFEAQKYAHEGIIPVAVRSRYPVDQNTQSVLTKKIEKAYQKKPHFEHQIDEQLLGGLVYQVGDLVYDCSVQGWLTRLRSYLKG